MGAADFKKGDRVRIIMPEHRRTSKAGKLATVIGHSRDGECVWVLRDGCKPTSSDRYSYRFLEKVPAEDPQP